MNSRNRVASCKRDNWRLLDKNFESKSIKERSKISILTNSKPPRNKCLIKPPTTWPHPPSQTYILPENSITWIKLEWWRMRGTTGQRHHKMLKELEAMIDVQKQIKNIMKITAETNMMITEMENSILKASINNRVINTTNITGMSKDLWYLIQSDIENQVFQI